MKTPHKHAELIHAWADGETIEVLDVHRLWVDVNEKWAHNQSPSWYESMEYRIKPEPKQDVVKYSNAVQSFCSDGRRQDSNLKLTFDGETGKLKSAEVL